MIGRATANGKVFDDTKERGKPIVFRYGARPFTGGLCQGVEEALSTMKAGVGAPLLSLPVLPPTQLLGDNRAPGIQRSKDLSGSTALLPQMGLSRFSSIHDWNLLLHGQVVFD